MVVLDDYVIALGAGVSIMCLIIIATFLARYRTLVEESRKSNELAKNIFDSMTARFNTQDTRIVDLMARFEVYSVRQKPPVTQQPAQKTVMPEPKSQDVTRPAAAPQPMSQLPMAARQSEKTTNPTEETILRSLAEGPKTPGMIKDVISAARGREFTREHTGRLLKGLYDRGLVVRNDQNKPFVYEITDAGRSFLKPS